MKSADSNFKNQDASAKANAVINVQNFIPDLNSLDTLLDRVIAKWSPKQIWLFGSRARGEAKIDSDWDIFVVVEDSVPEGEFNPLVAWRLQQNSGVCADIFLCRNSDFQSCQNTPNTLSYCVAVDGVLLYGN